MRGASWVRGVPQSFFSERGFTLVELMIVVAILGLLATIGIPNYMRMRERAKMAEAKANLGAIRVCEHGYFAEYSHYLGNQDFVPDRTADPPARFPWVDGTRFSILGFSPEGQLLFSYGLSGVDHPPSGFTAEARGDLDGDGNWSIWRIVSDDKEITHLGAAL